jgi:hypothetical protein
MKWIIAAVVLLFYVQLFNVLATKYFESGRTMTWRSLLPLPPMKITIEM